MRNFIIGLPPNEPSFNKEIIENPNSLKAYKEIEVYKVAEVSEEMDIKECKKILLFTYEELFKEIIEQLTKGE